MRHRLMIPESQRDDYDQLVISKASQVLVGWQRAFFQWKAEQPRKKIKQLAKLEELTGTAWTEAQRLELCSSGIAAEYYNVLHERNKAAARQLMEDYCFESVQGMRWALARAQKKGDYRAIPNLASPGIERAEPRRESTVNQQLNVTITLTDGQQQLLDGPTIPIEVEVIETKTDVEL